MKIDFLRSFNVKRIKFNHLSLIIFLPLLYTIPISSVFQNSFSIFDTSVYFKEVYKKVTLSDFLLILILLINIYKQKLLSQVFRDKLSLALIMTLLLSLILQLVFYKNYLNTQMQFDFLNWFGLLLIFLVSGSFGKLCCSSVHFFIGLLVYFTFVFAISYLNGISVFQHLPLYENYLDLLTHRFKGLSYNTNNFSLGLFCSFALYILISERKPIDRWDIAIYILVVCAFTLTLGRHGLFSVGLILIAYLAKKGSIKWVIVISSLLVFISIASLRINIVPLKSDFPFLNFDRSTYSVVHDTYLHMVFYDGTAFGLPDKIIEQKYKLFIDEENYAEIVAQRGKSLDSIHTFMSSHSVLLELATKFGLLSLTLYFGLCLILMIKMGKSIQSTIGISIVILHILSCLFIETSRIGWLFLFCLNAYAISQTKSFSHSTNY